MYNIKLVVGDNSGDGHMHKDTIIVISTHPRDQVEKAHKKACDELGIDWYLICLEYEDNNIDGEYLKILQKVIPNEVGDGYYIYTEQFVSIYIALVRLGDPSIEIKIATYEHIYIGGYGLY